MMMLVKSYVGLVALQKFACLKYSKQELNGSSMKQANSPNLLFSNFHLFKVTDLQFELQTYQ